MDAHKIPPQQQHRQPGIESKMRPLPRDFDETVQGTGKLRGKVAVITGGDSGIGRAVALSFAREGARVAILYLEEHGDAQETCRRIEAQDTEAFSLAGDIGEEQFCRDAVQQIVQRFGTIDVLVNNAAEQHEQDKIEDITQAQLERTFRTNIFSFFFLTKAALPHMKKGSTIINTTSVTAYRGSPHLLDYSSTKGAIVSFTRSLAGQLVERGIRVNAVAPGPVWTPLIPASFSPEDVAKFGQKVPMERPGEPCEIAPAYVFLATKDSSYMTGQVLHPNGGEIVNA